MAQVLGIRLPTGISELLVDTKASFGLSLVPSSFLDSLLDLSHILLSFRRWLTGLGGQGHLMRFKSLLGLQVGRFLLLGKGLPDFGFLLGSLGILFQLCCLLGFGLGQLLGNIEFSLGGLLGFFQQSNAIFQFPDLARRVLRFDECTGLPPLLGIAEGLVVPNG